MTNNHASLDAHFDGAGNEFSAAMPLSWKAHLFHFVTMGLIPLSEKPRGGYSFGNQLARIA